VNLFEPKPSLLDGLNEAQRYAVTLGDGPILVIAGAGTGKTRTLVHRVAWLVEQGVPAQAILLLTFTRRAAQEMLSRAHELHPDCAGVQGGTFHSLGHRLLRAHGGLIGLAAHFTVLDPADVQQMVRGALDELGLKPKGDRRFPKNRTIADIISKSRNLELGLEETLELHYPHLLPYLDQVAAVARHFEQTKRAQHLIDYDDLLFLTEKLLRENRGLRQELGRRWRHILVDEYQDTNAVQARLLELLAEGHRNLMVVGDDAQSIYAFRGARLQNIFEFPSRFPGTRLVKLEQNYRSTQPILDLSNQVIARAIRRYEKNLFTELGEGPRPELFRPREQKDQSRQVVRRIRRLKDQGARLSEIAVLFRAGRDSFDLETELRAEGIPFVKYGGIRFVELAHVKDLMAHLRVVANPADFLSWQRLLMLLPGIGPKGAQAVIGHLVQAHGPGGYLERLASAPQAKRIGELKELAALLERLAGGGLTPVEMVEEVLEYYQPICTRTYDDYPRRLKDLEELPALAAQSEGLVEFLADTVLDPPDSEGAPPQEEPLTLSTVHSAKGKEWPHLIILWASDGRFPAFPTLEDDEALEEERRLMYVALTRAGRSLAIYAPREHYFEAGGWRRLPPSRFLDELPQGLMEYKQSEQVFPVPSPSAAAAPAPASRGSHTQKRPYPVGTLVEHPSFGDGKVMGYKGADKIIVHFTRFGLKILLLRLAKLRPKT